MAQSETTQTEVGHEGGGHSNFPPFDASTFPAQILWFFIAFGLLYWFMSKRALPQIGAVIENRKARIARDLGDTLLVVVEFLERENRQIKVVLFKAVQAGGIVHQHVGVEHEQLGK